MMLIRIFLSTFFTALPALFWSYIVVTATHGEYYWQTYFSACGILLAVSGLNGVLFPLVFKSWWKKHPSLFIFLQGVLAWIAACFTLGLLNITPMCVGQDNGDGSNDLGLCMLQTSAAILFYSPIEGVLLTVSAAGGGIVSHLTARF